MDTQTRKLIVKLFDEGKPLAEIAEVVGYCESRMTQILQEEGRSAWKRRYPNMDSVDDVQVMVDYRGGMPLVELLEKHQISQTTLYRWLKEHDMAPRGRVGAPGKQNYQYKHGNGNQPEKRIPELTKQVAALCLGHIVPRGWQIHHLDGDPSNNHPENLAIFHNKSEHACFHQLELRLQREGGEVNTSQLVSETGGFLLPLPTHPILLPHEKGRLDPRKRARTPRSIPSESAPQKDPNAPQ